MVDDAELAGCWMAGKTKTNQEEIKTTHFIGHPLETSGSAEFAAGGTPLAALVADASAVEIVSITLFISAPLESLGITQHSPPLAAEYPPHPRHHCQTWHENIALNKHRSPSK